MNRLDFFIEFIKLPLLLVLGVLLGAAVALFSSADALISHGIVKTRQEAINLMGYPKKRENGLEEKKTVRDYLIGGITICLIMVPEAVMMCVSIFYLMIMYMTFKFNSSPQDKTQALASLIIFIICPIGAYYFYEKTVIKTLYDELVVWLSDHTSIITSDKRMEAR